MAAASSMFRRHCRLALVFLGVLLAGSTVLLGGCSIVYKTTGQALTDYSNDAMAPYILTTDDTGMACSTGKSLSNLLLSFGEVTSTPHKVGSLSLEMAALCSERKAVSAHLRYLRDVDQGRPKAAQDARIVEKRREEVTARRRYRAYKLVVAQYGEPGKQCPDLYSDYDQLVWMMGMVTGVQAVLNDMKDEGVVQVPQDIAAKVALGARCLNDDKWFGVPLALRAAVWVTVPGTRPKGRDPWAAFRKAIKIGNAKGVRLPYTLEAIAAYGQGKNQIVRHAIQGLARARKDKPADSRYRLLDQIAYIEVRNISDRMWTNATGHRTPFDGLGRFWNQKQPKGPDLNQFLSSH